MLDLQLEIRQQLDAGRQLRVERRDAGRAERIVTAARVADADQQWRVFHQSRRRLLTVLPSTSSSSTISGILPSACVAHDRQG